MLELLAYVAAHIIEGAATDPDEAFEQAAPAFLIVASQKDGEALPGIKDPAMNDLRSYIVTLAEAAIFGSTSISEVLEHTTLSESDARAADGFANAEVSDKDEHARRLALGIAAAECVQHHRPHLAAQRPWEGLQCAAISVDAKALWAHVAQPLAHWLDLYAVLPKEQHADALADCAPVGALPQPQFMTIPSTAWPDKAWHEDWGMTVRQAGDTIGRTAGSV